MYINVAGEIYHSLVNGPGMRYVIFFQGCTRKCKNCQNEHTWKIGAGIDMTTDEIITNLENSVFIDGITISGGEPFLQENGLCDLCRKIKEKFPNYTIMIYTGYTIEDLKSLNNNYINETLKLVDYIAEGEYQCNNPTSKKYVGSNNQRVINMKTGEEIFF